MANVILAFFLGVIKLLFSLLFSVAAVYFAIRVFDAITGELDEWREIKKGNVAVSIYFGAVIFTFSLIIAPSLLNISGEINSFTDSMNVGMLLFLIVDIVGLIFTILLSAIALYLTILMIDAFSHGMKKFKQIKNGNIAVAITLAAILLAVGIVIQQGVVSLSHLIDPTTIFVAVQ